MYFRWMLKGTVSTTLLLSAVLAAWSDEFLCWTFNLSVGASPKERRGLAKGVDQICLLRGA